MDSITEYLLSITAAGILCAVVRLFLGDKHSSGKIIQAVCGVFMAITVFAPILHIKFSGFDNYFKSIQYSAEDVAAEGTEMACDAMAEIIKQQSESYILDKAESVGASVGVSVKMSETNPPVPKEVIISGSVSPYDKKIISQYITANFGISEENQQWI